jgi:hypothetical protein
MSSVASLRGERSMLDRLLEKLEDKLLDRLLESVLEKLLDKLLDRDDETLWTHSLLLSQASLSQEASLSSICGLCFFGRLLMRAAVWAGMRGVDVGPRHRHSFAQPPVKPFTRRTMVLAVE